MAIIYCAENNVNSKCYIGQTIKTLEQRKKEHNNIKITNHFHNALRKYDDWTWTVLQEYKTDKRKIKSVLNKAEIYYIEAFDSYRNGYNMTKGGNAFNGYIYTDEVKNKMSKSAIGKVVSKETKKKISKSHKGKKHSDETKDKMSVAHKKRYENIEARKKTSEATTIWWAKRKGDI